MNILLCKMLLSLVLEIKFSHSCLSLIYVFYVFICVLSTSSPLYMINGVGFLRTLYEKLEPMSPLCFAEEICVVFAYATSVRRI